MNITRGWWRSVWVGRKHGTATVKHTMYACPWAYVIVTRSSLEWGTF